MKTKVEPNWKPRMPAKAIAAYFGVFLAQNGNILKPLDLKLEYEKTAAVRPI